MKQRKFSRLQKFCARTALILTLGGGLTGCDSNNSENGERSSRAWPIIGGILTAVGLATCISVARDEYLEQKANKQKEADNEKV